MSSGPTHCFLSLFRGIPAALRLLFKALSPCSFAPFVPIPVTLSGFRQEASFLVNRRSPKRPLAANRRKMPQNPHVHSVRAMLKAILAQKRKIVYLFSKKLPNAPPASSVWGLQELKA